MEFKLGTGPMSTLIVDLLMEYSALYSYPLMIIASRNQVDYATGYVYTSAQLASRVKSRPESSLLLCRDHCGPYYSDLDIGKSLAATIDQCKLTIDADISAGFDLIHIDVSRIKNKQLHYGAELIEYAINMKPGIIIEFGSEDNCNMYSCVGIADQLSFLTDYKRNVKYFVTRTGSLTKHTQVGTFDVDANRTIANLIHKHGFLFKEHNADYMTREQLAMRTLAGIDAINIAPELGVVQTNVITRLGAHLPEFARFRELVLTSGHWKKWITSSVTDTDVYVAVAGHYSFNSDEYNALYEAIVRTTPCHTIIKQELFTTLDLYRTGFI